jgi:uncharacterized protein YciI
MIAVELTFTDDPRRLEARPAHRAILATLHRDGVLLAAGPWGDDSGALLLFRADLDGVEAILREDPYYATPGVTVAAVRVWEPVVGGL